MNRMAVASAASAALLSLGCDADWLFGPNDPSTIPRVPLGTQGIPTREALIARWTPGEGPFSRYNKLTLLTSLGGFEGALPDIESSGAVPEARRAAHRLAQAGLSADTLWMIDMRGPASVVFGATLSQEAHEPVSLVLTFNNWPDEGELVPAELTAAALVRTMPNQAPSNTAGARPVFLLDAWRLAYPHTQIDEEVFDNRYLLNPADLPSPEVLSNAGIRRVVYVVENIQQKNMEEDDLHQLFQRYQDAGISLAIADLAMLTSPDSNVPIADADLDASFEPREVGIILRPLVIFPRRTLFDDPYFYGVAHAHFGVVGHPVFAHPGAGRGGGFGHVGGHPSVGHGSGVGHVAAHPSVGHSGGFGHGGG